MSMTIAVTRNTPDRFDGFFASSMIEIAPGVYVAPRMKKSVRNRVWKTVMEWGELLPSNAGVVLFWKSRTAPSGLGVRLLGWPKKELVNHEGAWLAIRNLRKDHEPDRLDLLSEYEEPPPDEHSPIGEHLRQIAGEVSEDSSENST